MPNERLRAALLEHGLTPSDLADRIGVDHKTVERWVAGRAPYRKHRYMVAGILRKDEEYLWPGALTREQVTAASDSELLAIYPHRSDVPRDTWMQLFTSAEREIGVLVYAGLFVRLRILLGDPDSPEVAQRGIDDGVGDAMAAKIRNALAMFKPLRALDGPEFRFHRTTLYNSIYYGDDQLLVNTHVYGVTAAGNPVWYLRKVPGGEIASTYLTSFERVWETGTPIPGPDA